MTREPATVDGTSAIAGGVVLARVDGRRITASAEAVRRGGWRRLRPGQQVVVVLGHDGEVTAVEPVGTTAPDGP